MLKKEKFRFLKILKSDFLKLKSKFKIKRNLSILKIIILKIISYLFINMIDKLIVFNQNRIIIQF